MKYKKSIKEGQYRTAIHFWQSVQEDARFLEVFDIYGKNRNFFMTDKDGEKKGGGEESKVGKSSGDSPRKSSADSPKREKNGSKNGVRTGLGSAGAYMTDGIHTVAFDGSRDIMKKSLKPLKISRGQIARLSEGFSTKQLPLRPPFFCPLAGGFSQLEVGDISFSDPEGGYMTIAQAVAKKSAILTDNTAVQVLAVCCPQLRCTDLLPSSSLNTFDQGLYLRFSTSEHGFSLSSLYASAAGISPLVLLIKPTKDGQVRQHRIRLVGIEQDRIGHLCALYYYLPLHPFLSVFFPTCHFYPTSLPSSLVSPLLPVFISAPPLHSMLPLCAVQSINISSIALSP